MVSLQKKFLSLFSSSALPECQLKMSSTKEPIKSSSCVFWNIVVVVVMNFMKLESMSLLVIVMMMMIFSLDSSGTEFWMESSTCLWILTKIFSFFLARVTHMEEARFSCQFELSTDFIETLRVSFTSSDAVNLQEVTRRSAIQGAECVQFASLINHGRT